MFKIDKILIGILVVYFLILVSTINNPHHADEATHSFVGMFISDFVKDFIKQPTLSFTKIYDYAISYMSYYPKVSLHYPPLPQSLFSLAYLIFGSSIQASRLVIILMSVTFATLIYIFAYIHSKNKVIALIAVLFVTSTPILLNMSILAMQEIPFILFFTLTMLWLYIIKGKKPRLKNFVILGLLTSLTVVTKWQAITIIPVLLFYTLLIERRLLKFVLLSLLIAVVLLSPYYLFLWKTNLLLVPLSANVEGDPTDPTWLQLQGWAYYLNSLFNQQFIWPVGIIALVSTALYCIRKNKDWKFFATWILVIFLIMVFIHNKDARYTINYLPAFIIPTSYIVYNYSKKNGYHHIFVIFFIGLILGQFFISFINIPQGLRDVESIAKFINEGEGNVLVHMNMGAESPFVFEIARNGKFKQQVFRPCTVEFLNKTHEELLNDFNIKYIIVDKLKSGFTEKQIDFSSYLLNRDFSKVKDFEQFAVFRYEKYTHAENAIICNYICATREFVCSKFKTPSNALE